MAEADLQLLALKVNVAEDAVQWQCGRRRAGKGGIGGGRSLHGDPRLCRGSTCSCCRKVQPAMWRGSSLGTAEWMWVVAFMWCRWWRCAQICNGRSWRAGPCREPPRQTDEGLVMLGRVLHGELGRGLAPLRRCQERDSYSTVKN